MTTILHLDSEITDVLRHRMRQTAEDLYDSASRLYTVVAMAGWEGGSREELLDNLYRTTALLRQQAEQLDQLSFQLRAETERWQAAAAALQH